MTVSHIITDATDPCDITTRVQQEYHCTFVEALKGSQPYIQSEAVNNLIDDFFAGIDPLKDFSNADLEKMRSDLNQRKDQNKYINNEKAEQTRKDVQELFEKTVPIANTQAESYLREERGIKGELSENLRYIPADTSFSYKEQNRSVYTGALASIARDEHGNVKSLQLTYLKDGKRLSERT